MKPPIIIAAALAVLVLLLVWAPWAPANLHEQSEQIEADIEAMGITVREVVITGDGVTVSYVYPVDQTIGDTGYDWIGIGTAVMMNTESKPQIIRIRPEIEEVPVYEVQMDSRDLVLFLDGRIGPEVLLFNLNYVWLTE